MRAITGISKEITTRNVALILFAVLSMCAALTACIGDIHEGEVSQLSAPSPARTLVSSTPISSPTPSVVTSTLEQPRPTILSTSPVASSTATVLPTATPSSTWRTLVPGVARRYIPVILPDTDRLAYVYALRFDPTHVTFRVHYDDNQAHSVEEWQAITDAWIVVNGGFFSGTYSPVGRIVVDGLLYGYPLDYGDDSIGVPGLFAVLDGVPALYALGHSSYSPRGLRFDQAIECYPLLLLPGQQPTFPIDTSHLARRTVIALDDQGHVIILLIDLPIFSLYELSNWLANSDLGLDSALNLDGGRSSGLIVSLADEAKLIPSVVPLPIVLAIYPRGR